MTKSIRRVHDANFKTKRGRPSGGPRSTQRSQNRTGGPACPDQQRFRHPRSADYRLETTGTRWNSQHIRVANQQTDPQCRTAGTNRKPSISADWPAKSRKRLAQKKIANQLGTDRSHLIEPAHSQLSINQQCHLLSIPHRRPGPLQLLLPASGRVSGEFSIDASD